MNLLDQHLGVDQPNEPISKGSGAHSPAPSVLPSDQTEKIVVVCPNCRATLRVRRVYIGNQVRCRQCEHVFTVEVPRELEARPADDVPRESAGSPTQEPESRREITRLTDERDRVTTERDELATERNRLGLQLNEVGAMRDALRSEVDRLEGEIRDLRANQSAHAVLASELEGRIVELNSARHELAQVGGKLLDREAELNSARALHADLSRQLQTAIEEVKVLQTNVEERDEAIRHQTDEHRAELESHIEALNQVRQQHREPLERLQAELVDRSQRHDRLQEELQAKNDLCGRLQDRIVDLERAQDRIKAEYQSAIEAERSKQKELTVVSPAPTAQLQAALAEVDELTQWLAESQRLNRDMAALLTNIGITYSPPVRR